MLRIAYAMLGCVLGVAGPTAADARSRPAAKELFNPCCEPRLTQARLIEIMEGAVGFMAGPEGVDKDLGMPSDGHRLVQKFSYAGFTDHVRDGKLTPLGKAYRALADRYAAPRTAPSPRTPRHPPIRPRTRPST